MRKKDFNGFDPDKSTKKEIKRYFKMAEKEEIKFTRYEKTKIKKELLKNVKQT